MLIQAIASLIFLASAQAQVPVTDLVSNNLTPAAQIQFNQELTDRGMDADEVKKTSILYNQADQIITVTAPADSKLSAEHLFFIGARVGIILPFGMDATYLDLRNGKKQYHVVVGGTYSYGMKTIEAGAGWHPRGRAFYMGARVKDVFEGGTQFLGVSPELGWMKVWGKNQNVMGSIGLGATRTFGQYYHLPIMADIHFGIAIKFLKR